MTRKQKTQPNQNTKSQPQKPPPIASEVQHNEQEGAKTETSGNCSHQVNYKHPEIIMRCSNNEKTKRPIWKKIHFWATIVNFFLLIATFFIWRSGVNSAQAAHDSAATADSTFQEIKNEFKISNEPFIEYAIISIDQPVVGRVITFKEMYTNYGSYPARILSETIATAITNRNKTFEEILNHAGTIDTSKKYILKNSPYTKIANGHIPVTKETIDSLNSRYVQFYIAVHLTYENLINKDIKDYKCLIRTHIYDSGFEYLLNENSQ